TSNYLLPNESSFGTDICSYCLENIVDEAQFRCASCPDFTICSECSVMLPDDPNHNDHGFKTTFLRTPAHVRVPKTTFISTNGIKKDYSKVMDELGLGSHNTKIWLTLGFAYKQCSIYVSVTKPNTVLYFEIKGRAIETYDSVQ